MPDRLQYLWDVHAIREVSLRYNRYADAADGESFASLFTEDGEFDIVGNKLYRGRAEIAAVCAAAKGIVHLSLDSQVEIDGDTARQTSKLIVLRLAADKSSLEFVSTTTLTDRFVRRGDTWLIKRRRSHLDLDPAISLARLALQ